MGLLWSFAAVGPGACNGGQRRLLLEHLPRAVPQRCAKARVSASVGRSLEAQTTEGIAFIVSEVFFEIDFWLFGIPGRKTTMDHGFLVVLVFRPKHVAFVAALLLTWDDFREGHSLSTISTTAKACV